jgi:hypothetical protein
MDIGGVLKRAWHMVWHYRALWVFGIVLALTAGSWGTYAILGDNDGDEGFRRGITVTRMDNETFPEAVQRGWRAEVAATRADINDAERDLERFSAHDLHHPIDVHINVLGLMTGLLLVLMVLVIVGTIARHVSEAALIQMVDQYEETGERRSFGQGLRLGWSRTAWRLFLIELVVDVPVVLALIALYVAVFAPLALGLWGGTAAAVVAGSLVTVGLLLLAVAATFVAVAVLSLLKQFFRRACAVDQLGVVASIRKGFAVAKQNALNAGVMGLIVVGLNLLWMVAMIPVVFTVLVAAGILGALPGFAAFSLASLAWSGAAPVLVAIGVGLFFFFLVLAAPLVFMDGLRMVFVSSTWTLTYRDLGRAESPEKIRAPKPDAQALGAAAAG